MLEYLNKKQQRKILTNKKMETIIYIIIFAIGALFGSFYSLAIYRIPKKQDITHTRSYCPNCDHKLGFFDMFPILSYLFLRGKCRYCKRTISPRYLFLEVFSGITFVAIFYFMKIDLYNISITSICEYAFFALFITYIFLTAGIESQNRRFEKSVSIYGIIIAIMYIAYLCIIEKASIYRYAIYLSFYVLILLLDTLSLKKHAKEQYIYGILYLIITMGIFTGERVTFLTITFTLLVISIYMILNKIKRFKNKSLKTDANIYSNLKIGFYLGVTNIICLLYALYMIMIK